MTISTILPDVATYSSQPPQLTDTVVIHASTAEKYSYPEHATPYLLLPNLVNRGNYVLNRNRVEVSASHFYFLNPNDTLEIRFPTAAPLQTWMILFDEKFIGDCFHYLSTSDQQLLDSPDGHPPIAPRFANAPFDLTDTIKRQLLLLVRSQPDQDVVQEALFTLIAECNRLNAGTVKDIDKITAVKKSTGEELYRRLYLSREWINDNLTSKITLDQITWFILPTGSGRSPLYAAPVSDHTSSAEITYSFTGLNDLGNEINRHFLQIIYQHDLSDWADDINHYLAAPR